MRIQNQLIIINIIGGLFVLGGYVYALINNPTNRMQLWGGVPENYRSWIVGMMFVSAFGYCYAMKFLLLDDGIPFKFFFGLMGERFILITQIIFFRCFILIGIIFASFILRIQNLSLVSFFFVS